MDKAAEANQLALTQLTGLGLEEAAEKLTQRVRIHAGVDVNASRMAVYLRELLGRTLRVVDDGEAELSVHVGTVTTTAGAELFVTFAAGEVAWSSAPGAAPAMDKATVLPALFLKVAACYLTGYVIAKLVSCEKFKNLPDGVTISAENLGLDFDSIARGVRFDNDVLIGAGGVGNGFLWALSDVPSAGRIRVADTKVVSDSNLNRCLYFDEADLGKPKVEVLASKVKLAGAELVPFHGSFKELLAQEPGNLVRRVFTTVDSRPARRAIRSELPLEILDASTTDLSSVVVFSERQPTDKACLSCIYKHVPEEDEHERAVAKSLGLTVAEVQLQIITTGMAEKILTKYPDRGLAVADLVGVAVDSQFRNLCGQGVLEQAGGEQTLAPLGFISNLAGALLVIELLRFDSGAKPTSNYMNLSPWRAPFPNARRNRGRSEDCEFCSKPEVLAVLHSLCATATAGILAEAGA